MRNKDKAFLPIYRRIIIGVAALGLTVASAAARELSPAEFAPLHLGSWTFLRSLPIPVTSDAADVPSGLTSYRPYLAHLLSATTPPSGKYNGSATANFERPMIDPIHTAAIVPGVFGSYAIPMHNFPVSGRWAGIFDAVRNCANRDCMSESPAFSRIVASVEGKPFSKKLAGVNRQINQLIRYRKDQAVYGRRDFWASPLDTLSRGAGDCEDFAILKMSVLLKAGIPASSMSLVVLQSRSKGVFHAVLSVSTSNGAYVLDNLTNAVPLDASISDYLPLYSLSTDRAWIHGSKSGARIAAGTTAFGSIVPGEGPDLPAAGPLAVSR